MLLLLFILFYFFLNDPILNYNYLYIGPLCILCVARMGLEIFISLCNPVCISTNTFS